MRGFYQKCMMLLVVCILCMISQNVDAAEKEYDFNKKKTITIKAKDTFTKSGSYSWLKYTPSADGYIKIQVSALEEGDADAKGYIALYDSAKTNLFSSKSIYYNTAHTDNAYWHTFTFGLQAKQTYYFRIKAENAVKLTRKFTKTKDKSGDLRSTALEIKKNKYKTGLIPAGISNTDWYVLHLIKKQKIKLYYQAKTSGSFRITVYMGDTQIGTRRIYYTSGEKKITFSQYLTTSKKKVGMDPGTYYIRVERADSMSSGYYKIKWK